MRNDHQDALSAGLAVNEYATSSKSADEIRGLWQWVEAKLRIAVTDDQELANDLSISPLATVIIEPSETAVFA
jgi:chromosome partitioning protein